MIPDQLVCDVRDAVLPRVTRVGFSSVRAEFFLFSTSYLKRHQSPPDPDAASRGARAPGAPPAAPARECGEMAVSRD